VSPRRVGGGGGTSHISTLESSDGGGAAMARASHILLARGRSEPPVAVSGLPLYELRMLANHGWPSRHV
jgi:hypothetical protein